MTGCFGYIGYAVGAILSAKLAGVTIELSDTSVNIKSQLMFVIAFAFNVISLYLLSSKARFTRFKSWQIFLFFLITDTAVPLIYQSILSHRMSLQLALIIGLFPALIITAAFKVNLKNLQDLYSRSKE